MRACPVLFCEEELEMTDENNGDIELAALKLMCVLTTSKRATCDG